MKSTVLIATFLISSSALLFAQSRIVLPGGPIARATRALPVTNVVIQPPVSVSNTNIANLVVNTSRPPERTVRPAAGGARADFGLQKAFFPVDVKAGGPITITTPSARLLSFRATFLALHDLSSRQSLLIAEVTNRIGAIIGADQVIYTNAFDTLQADIRYRYTAQSLEQDIILHEHPQLPKEFSPENTRLEIWTEWFDSEPISKSPQSIDLRAADTTGLLTPSLIEDEGLDFGTMKIVTGHAFSSTTQDEKTPVGKSWVRIDGRDWLVETVDYLAVREKLDLLPAARRTASNQRPSKRHELIRRLAKQSAPEPTNDARMLMAKANPAREPEFVMDFVIVSSVPVPPNAISWWPAGGTTNDAISTNHLSWIGTNSYAAGKVGRGFSFNGTNYLAVTNATRLGPTNALTFETWVFIPSGTSGLRMIALKGTASQWQYLLILDENTVYAFVEGSVYLSSTAPLSANTWHHIAMTFNVTNEVLSLYIDGQPDIAGALPGGFVPNSDPLFIGGNPDAIESWRFIGGIDEPTIYDRVLGPSEILAIYNAGAAGKHNPQCTTAPTNIVGWWPGDANTYDLARTNVATWHGSAAYAAGVVSDAFQTTSGDFWLGGSWVEIPDRPEFNPTNELTLEAWVYPTATAYGPRMIIAKDAEYVDRQYQLSLSSGNTFRAHIWADDGTLYYFDSTASVSLNSWYHVAMTYNRTNLVLYVNGVQDWSIPATKPIKVTTQPLRIGAVAPYPDGAAYSFPGLIDEPTIYDRALTSTEISALYAAGGAGKCKVDTDADGLTDLQESFLQTNSNVADSDGDGLTDGNEVFVYHTNPKSQDSDGDGIIDQPFNVIITRP